MMTAPNGQTTPAISIQDVNFDGDSINVIEKDGEILVALKPICIALGLDWGGQYRNLKEDVVLSSTIVVMTMVAQDEKQREMVCIPLEYLNGWLFKMNPSRYQGELRGKIIQYQKDCYRVLHDHFFPTTEKIPAAQTTPPQLKGKLADKRTQVSYIKTVMAMEKQANEMALRIYKGKGTLEDLALCPDLQAMTRAALDELNRGDMFSSSDTDTQVQTEKTV